MARKNSPNAKVNTSVDSLTPQELSDLRQTVEEWEKELERITGHKTNLAPMPKPWPTKFRTDPNDPWQGWPEPMEPTPERPWADIETDPELFFK